MQCAHHYNRVAWIVIGKLTRLKIYNPKSFHWRASLTTQLTHKSMNELIFSFQREEWRQFLECFSFQFEFTLQAWIYDMRQSMIGLKLDRSILANRYMKCQKTLSNWIFYWNLQLIGGYQDKQSKKSTIILLSNQKCNNDEADFEIRITNRLHRLNNEKYL